jgi:hypothetical protein
LQHSILLSLWKHNKDGQSSPATGLSRQQIASGAKCTEDYPA